MTDKLRTAAQQAERAAFEAWVAKVQPTYWRVEAWQTEAWSMWQSISAALAEHQEPLTFETAAEARADREHAEAYYRQAEHLLTANERTLHAEIARLEAQLAEQPAEQEPVAVVAPWPDYVDWLRDEPPVGTKLYTAPQPAKREPLTDAEIGQVRWQCRWNRMSTDDNVVYATTQQLDAFARAAIAAYERKNGIGGQS